MSINIFQMQDYRMYLGALLQKRCLRNSSYSQRAFARDLEIAPGFLCLVLNSKKSLSCEKARTIVDRLELLAHEKDYFVALVEKERSGDDTKVLEIRQTYAFQQLCEDDPLPEDISLQEFALLQQIALLGHVEETLESAHVVGLDIEALRKACRRLAALGWLKGSIESGWSSHRGLIRAEGYESSESIRVFHQKVLELGLKQLHEGMVEDRYFNSLVFSFSCEQYQAFCTELKAFCLSKCDAYSTRNSHDRIYILGLQLLPIAELKRKRSRPSDLPGRS